jgi:iron complex outermembrane receptor protein
VEGGIKWVGDTVPAQAMAAVYQIRERNRLATDPENFGETVQIGEATIKGVELETRGQMGAWNVIASYSYTQARASATSWGGDLDPTQQIEGIPEHQASFWAVHDFARLGLPVTAGGGLRYVGRIGDGTGLIFVPAVTLLDLMGSYTVGNWRMSVNVNNLTDKAYIATCLSRGDCWFGQRRTVSLTAGFTY